jgi:hypothetical protein
MSPVTRDASAWATRGPRLRAARRCGAGPANDVGGGWPMGDPRSASGLFWARLRRSDLTDLSVS